MKSLSKPQAYKVTVSFVCRPLLDSWAVPLTVAKACLRTRRDLAEGFSAGDSTDAGSSPVSVISVEPVEEPLTAEEALKEIRVIVNTTSPELNDFISQKVRGVLQRAGLVA